MGKRITDVEGVAQYLKKPSKWSIYDLVKHPTHPLPYKKMGGRYAFDLDAVDRWFDSLPGRDSTTLGDF